MYFEVDSEQPANENGERCFLCLCECGNEIIATEKQVKRKQIVCSCMKNRKNELYNIWMGMKKRCNNPKDKDYKYYGARGIKVCDSWNDFDNFRLDMGDRPENKTIDRIDNDKGYSPENCRWATMAEQNANRRV